MGVKERSVARSRKGAGGSAHIPPTEFRNLRLYGAEAVDCTVTEKDIARAGGTGALRGVLETVATPWNTSPLKATTHVHLYPNPHAVNSKIGLTQPNIHSATAIFVLPTIDSVTAFPTGLRMLASTSRGLTFVELLHVTSWSIDYLSIKFKPIRVSTETTILVECIGTKASSKSARMHAANFMVRLELWRAKCWCWG
jgi:hypothetical protein